MSFTPFLCARKMIHLYGRARRRTSEANRAKRGSQTGDAGPILLVAICRHTENRACRKGRRGFARCNALRAAGLGAAVLLLLRGGEQRRDERQRGDADDDEHRAGQPAKAAAQHPAHNVKAPDAIDAPVDAADDDEQQQELLEPGIVHA